MAPKMHQKNKQKSKRTKNKIKTKFEPSKTQKVLKNLRKINKKTKNVKFIF